MNLQLWILWLWWIQDCNYFLWFWKWWQSQYARRRENSLLVVVVVTWWFQKCWSKGFLLCRRVLEPHETACLCKWVHLFVLPFTQPSTFLVPINPTEIGKSIYPHKHPLKKSQGTPATRPQCLTSPTARRSACSVELSTGNSPDWVISNSVHHLQ